MNASDAKSRRLQPSVGYVLLTPVTINPVLHRKGRLIRTWETRHARQYNGGYPESPSYLAAASLIEKQDGSRCIAGWTEALSGPANQEPIGAEGV